MSPAATTPADQIHPFWRRRLTSALRTALACTIIGCATLYGPAPLRRLFEFPAFSYVTAILIVSDATLGDTVRGCWYALYATIQVIIPSIFSLWMIRPAWFTNGFAASAVGIGAFFVALPESSELMTKRIAFGQLVIVYVGAVIGGAKTEIFMHPVHVAASTALGAGASVLAMLFPFPRLAYSEVRKTCRLYAENATERLNLFVDIVSAEDNPTALDLISRAKLLSKSGAKLLQTIQDNQGGMMWERPDIRFIRPNNCMDPGGRLQGMETLIRGLEIALHYCPTFPIGIVDEELKGVMQNTKVQIVFKLEQAKCSTPFHAITAPERKGDSIFKSLRTHNAITTSDTDLPIFFFLLCMELLQDDSPLPLKNSELAVENVLQSDSKESSGLKKQPNSDFKKIWSRLIIKPSSQRLMFAFKCSLSLGLAVLFGLMFNKENGYWSGLTIAISFVTGRQPLFTAANGRAQGTAMGSVYGILACFIFQKYLDLKFLPLLPWIIFTSFLRHSRMYGQPGGISAVIGALLILGRTNYGPPTEFAIARLTEACIGLICFIMVEILLQPDRAATLAKIELLQSIVTLRECIEEKLQCASPKNMQSLAFPSMREKIKELKTHVNELERFIEEARLEPNFWFLPFNGTTYGEIVGSLNKIVDLLLFVAYITELLSQASERFGMALDEVQEYLNDDLEIFKEKAGSVLKCLEELRSIKVFDVLQKERKEKDKSNDVEFGKSPHAHLDEEDVQKIVNSFLQHSKEIADKIQANGSDEEFTSQVVLCLNSMGFCISTLSRELAEIDKQVKELGKLENPP